MEKEKDLKYIKNFVKISVFQICKELKVTYSNVLNGTTTAEAIKQVKEELEKRVKEL